MEIRTFFAKKRNQDIAKIEKLESRSRRFFLFYRRETFAWNERHRHKHTHTHM